MKPHSWKVFICLIIVLGLSSNVAYGQNLAISPSFIDSIRNFQLHIIRNWQQRAANIASVVFLSLLVIQCTLYAYQIRGGKESINTNKLYKRFGAIIVIYILLMVFYKLNYITSGLAKSAQIITGHKEPINEWEVVKKGLFLSFKTLGQGVDVSLWNLLTKGPAMFVAWVFYLGSMIGIIISYLIMALQYSYITLEVLILVSIAPIPIAFGAMDFTRGITESYMKKVIQVGFKVFVYYFVYGLATTLLNSTSKAVSKGGFSGPHMDVLEFIWKPLVLVFICVLVVTLLLRIPGSLSKSLTEKLSPKFEELF